jgi:HAD superfamily hydrolase (TIGR01549 family)
MKQKEMLIIFDIDGTLCDTQEVDARCHVEAFEAVTGRSLATVDWSLYPEATSAAIVQDLLSEMGIPNAVDMEQRILDEFIVRLDAEARRNPESFRPVDGAFELFEDLGRREDYKIAIATGDWHESAKLKLRLTGFKTDHVPFASSSDTRRRADIIALAALKAGFKVGDAVYVGDGLWDIKAARELGMRFVGVGAGHERLRQHGASQVLVSFEDKSLFFSSLMK